MPRSPPRVQSSLECNFAVEGVFSQRLRAQLTAATEGHRFVPVLLPGYEELRTRQALPTLLEEVSPDLPPLPPLALPEALPSLPSVPPLIGETLGGGSGKLRAFAVPSGDSAEQRKLIQQRRDYELASKRLGLAATIGMRASKDAGDTLAYGVLPAATAVGKVAARRIPLPDVQLPGAVGWGGGDGSGAAPDALGGSGSGGASASGPTGSKAGGAPLPPPPPPMYGAGTAALMTELAAQLVEEYAEVATGAQNPGLAAHAPCAIAASLRYRCFLARSLLPCAIAASLRHRCTPHYWPSARSDASTVRIPVWPGSKVKGSAVADAGARTRVHW